MSAHYLAAANLIESVKAGKSLKALIGSSKGRSSKVQYALVVETLKYESTLRTIAEDAGYSLVNNEGAAHLKLVMLYDALLGRGSIQGGGALKKEIAAVLGKLQDARDRILQGKESKSELLSSSVRQSALLPLFVRVNSIKCSQEEGMQHLLSFGAAEWDKHIPSLAKLPSSAREVCQSSWVQQGKLIVQDKASCFPAQLLFDEWSTLGDGGDCVDACAAPGNKTSHLAALLHSHQQTLSVKQRARVFAFDKSSERAKVLSRRLQQCGAGGLVQVRNKDFLTINVNEHPYSRVKAVLLDPSCSGSGIVRDIGRVLARDSEPSDSGDDEKRLLKLQSFQLLTLRKAASFPAAEIVVYSTCSIHEEENECVVAQFLSSSESAGWELCAPSRLDGWEHRGVVGSSGLSAEDARKLIRCSMEDETNGFFVALFRRALAPSDAADQPSATTTSTKKRKIDQASQISEDANSESRTPAATTLFGKAFRISNSKKRRFQRRK